MSGVRVLIFRRCNGCDVFLGGGGAEITKLGFRSGFQLSKLSRIHRRCSFFGVYCEAWLVERSSGQWFGLRGDSISSLTWMEKERYRGSTVCKASIAYTLFGLVCRTQVSKADQISAASNNRADSLSRLKESGRSAAEDFIHLGFKDAAVVDLDGHADIQSLIGYVDPRYNIDTEDDFLLFWKGIQIAVRGICNH